MSNLNLHPLFRRSIGFDRLNDFIDYAMQMMCRIIPRIISKKSMAKIIIGLWSQLRVSVRRTRHCLENKLLTILGSLKTRAMTIPNSCTKALHDVHLNCLASG